MKNPVLAAVLVGVAFGFPGAASAALRKTSMAHSGRIALTLVPGKTRYAEYPDEDGGWRYSFDVQQGRSSAARS